MQLLRKMWIVLGLTFGLAACAPVEVSTDYSSKVDFGSFKTYAWYTEDINISRDSKQQLDAALDKLIRAEIESRLGSKGFSRSESGDVDFLVNYVVSSQTRIDLQTYHTYSGNSSDFVYTRGDGVQFGNFEASESDHYEYREGTLMIDVIDPATDKMMWRGVAEKRLDGELTDEQRAALVSEVVKKTLGQFPPR